MLPAQAIVEAIERAAIETFSEFRDRIFVNRTVPLSEGQGDLTAIIIKQGADEPVDDYSTFDRTGMSLAVEISFTDIGNDEAALLKLLNSYRLRMHRRLIRPITIDAPYILEFPWIHAVVTRGAAEPSTDRTMSTIAKELVTNWGVLYTMDRFNPDV